jgi:hypothetical protein
MAATWPTGAMTFRRASILTLWLAAAAAILWTVLQVWQWRGVEWTGSRPATCMPNDCFCERVRPQGLAQPVNTWSCVAFVWVAILMGADSRWLRLQPTANALGEQPANAIVFSLALGITGLGSALYHASLTFVGQFMDVLGMYFIATFLIIYQIGRRRRLSAKTVIGVFLIANASLATMLWYAAQARRYVFAVLILAVIGLELGKPSRPTATNPLLFVAAVVVLALGFAVWVLDITRSVCAPESMVQGHAIWHLAGAFASGLIYLYFRTERNLAVR